MPFKEGKFIFKGDKEKYDSKDSFVMEIVNENIYVSPNHPLSIRISEFLNKENWAEVEE